MPAVHEARQHIQVVPDRPREFPNGDFEFSKTAGGQVFVMTEGVPPTELTETPVHVSSNHPIKLVANESARVIVQPVV